MCKAEQQKGRTRECLGRPRGAGERGCWEGVQERSGGGLEGRAGGGLEGPHETLILRRARDAAPSWKLMHIYELL